MIRPAALLLDFGGVLGEGRSGTSVDNRHAAIARDLYELVDGAVPLDQISADLAAGANAYGAYTDAMARPFAPRELSHVEYWGDFVAADWPAPARAAVLARADELAYAWSDGGDNWRLRDGARDVIGAAHAAGIPMAVVSNILCGAPVRDFLARTGVGSMFGAQIYSDEVGIRKPNPGMVHAASGALGVQPADCWFVGDLPLRDVLAARRAGVGFVVLVQSDRPRGPVPGTPLSTPDIIVESMVDLHRLLVDALS